MGKSISVSLRDDELQKIDWWMRTYSMSRHEVIKFALRRFLFPEEQYVPLNGHTAEVKDIPIMPGHKSQIVPRLEGERGMTIANPPKVITITKSPKIITITKSPKKEERDES